LPALDFSDLDYKKKAQEDFQGLLRDAISTGLFD